MGNGRPVGLASMPRKGLEQGLEQSVLGLFDSGENLLYRAQFCTTTIQMNPVF